MASTNVSSVKCFNCGKFGHFRQNCLLIKSTRDIVRARLCNEASAIHIVHKLLPSIEIENEKEKKSTMIIKTGIVKELDEL